MSIQNINGRLKEASLKKIRNTVGGYKVIHLKFEWVKVSKKSREKIEAITGKVFMLDFLNDQPAWVPEMWNIDGTHALNDDFHLTSDKSKFDPMTNQLSLF